MRLKTFIYILIAQLACSSCVDLGEIYSVDLSDLIQVNSDAFCVLSSRVVDLSNGIPDDCSLPSEDAETRASSFDKVAMLSSLFNYHYRKEIIEIVGTYSSVDEFGNPITLSGKILLPYNKKFKRFILVSHYTIGSNAEAPSNAFPLEGMICPMGYAMVFPDYIGYGVTSDRIHPYLVREVTARNVADMLLAVQSYLDAAGYRPEKEDCVLMGYSQGGATTMCVEYQLEHETKYSSIKTHRLFAGGGPYDVRYTFEQYINDNYSSYPGAVLMVMQSMSKCMPYEIPLDKLLSPYSLEHIDEYVNSKQYVMSVINDLIGTKQVDKLTTPEMFNLQSDEVARFYSALTANSISSYNWKPRCACYIMHSMDDDVVSYKNAVIAKKSWQGANVEFNYGHYGTHTKTYLNFINVVKNKLEESD